MKRIPLWVLAGVLLLAGCTAQPATSLRVAPGEEEPASETAPSTPQGGDAIVVYRGQVEHVTDQTVEVVQVLPGHDYGYERIRFTITEETQLSAEAASLQEGCFVEVGWSGILTRSDPPLGTAERIEVLSGYSDTVLINGYILTAAPIENGYRLLIHVFSHSELYTLSRGEELDTVLDSDVSETTAILNVPATALEGMSEADLVEGARVSAVSNGVAALSMPPQYPVRALLTFSAARG